ncbi:MAG: hypothetical protein JST40_14390 [Armatimonadetes bacterium]|nr:hypothetical protein [Armatimonadota bacterium]
MRRVLVSLIVFAWSLACWAAPTENPIAIAARNLAVTGISAKSAPSSSPTKFKGSSKKAFVTEFANTLAEDAGQKAALEEGLKAYIDGYEEEAVKAKFGSDGAAALGFSIGVLYSVSTGKELTDAQMWALVPRIQAALDVPAVRSATDAQKQEFYEYSLCMSGLVLLLAQADATAANGDAMKKLAETNLTALVGAGPAKFTLKGNDLLLPGTGGSAPPTQTTTTAGGLAKGFTFTLPAGWQKSNQWYVANKVENRGGGDEVRSALVMFLPAMPATGNMGDALRKIWNTTLPSTLKDKSGSMVYRRYVGDGLFTQFIFGLGREADRRSDTMYTVMLIDCGTQWQPVIIAQIYEDRGSIRVAEDQMASYSYSETWPLVEPLLASFRCPGQTGKPIATRESLAGAYAFGSASNLQWVNIYTGASSMTFVSYGGTLTLKVDGSFDYTYSSASGQVGAAKFGSIKADGKWTISGDMLVLTYAHYDQGDSYKPKERKYRIAGLTQFADGEKVAIFMFHEDWLATPLSVNDSGDWYSTKKK